MKKIIFGFCIGLLLATSIMTLASGQPIKLIVNGAEVFSDVPPQIINSRTMIPARPLAEALGAKVEWDSENNSVVVTGGIQIGVAPTDLEPIGQNIVNEQNIVNDKKGDENMDTVIITFKGLNAIKINEEIYFSAKEYSDMFYNTKTFGYNPDKNIITFNEGENTIEIQNTNENIQIYNGRTYIHEKFYQ